MVNPVHRVHAQWTGAGRVVHRGPTVARIEGTVECSPELGLRSLRCTEARRRGRNRERETLGTQLGPHRGSGLTGAQAMLRRPGDGAAELGGGGAR
jgi:hypothetical protein